MFRRWRRWRAPCGPAAANGGRMTAAHDEADGVYRMKNVCLRAHGRPAGFEPTIDEFHGTTETARQKSYGGQPELNEWINSADKLHRAPECFVRRRALLLPLTRNTDNVGHMRYRTVSLLRAKQGLHNRTFADDTKDDDDDAVLIIFAVPSAEVLGKVNAMTRLYPLLSRHWAAVLAFSPTAEEVADLAPLSGAFRAQQPGAMCFAEVVLHSMCYKDCFTPELDARRPYLFAWEGDRADRDRRGLVLFQDALRGCVSAAPRSAARRDAPRVVYAARTGSRRFLESAQFMPRLAGSAAASMGVANFSVVEHVRLDAAAMFRLHLDADILIGQTGAALIWGALLPPGGVLIEVVGRHGCAKGITGWDKATRCDFGSLAAVVGARHLLVGIPRPLFPKRGPKGTPQDYRVPLAVFDKALLLATCALRQTIENCTVPVTMPFGPLPQVRGPRYQRRAAPRPTRPS
jgi:hypothetical protein